MGVISKQCYWCAEHVGNLNVWANVGLLFVKLIGGIFGRSQALIADAMHSIGDVTVSLLVVICLKITGAPPDSDHHWGHGNVEFIVSGIIGMVLLFAAVMITVVSFMSIMEGTAVQPSILAVWAALISVVFNEVLYRHALCIGKQMNSDAVIANALENRADAFSSLAALIGVFGARLGFTFLDPVAAIVVGLVIARSGLITLVSAVNGMTDRSVGKSVLDQIRELVMREPAVKDVCKLRSRRVGQKNWVDLEVMFKPELTMAEVKQAADRIRAIVPDRIESIVGVQVVPRAMAHASETGINA